jgi:hypothetical protein
MAEVCKSITLIHIKKIRDKKQKHINRWRKAFDRSQYLFILKLYIYRREVPQIK